MKSVAALEPMLDQSQVLDALGISRDTLWRWRRDKLFPPAVRLGANKIAWPLSVVQQWQESRPTVD